MQQVKYITDSDLEITKQNIERLFKNNQQIIVTFRKSRKKIETHRVTIEGVYRYFFTVKDVKLKTKLTIQFFDIITDAVSLSIADEKEGM